MDPIRDCAVDHEQIYPVGRGVLFGGFVGGFT